MGSLSTSTNQHSQFLFVLRDKTADRLFLMIDLTVEDNFDKMFENSNIQVKVPLKTQKIVARQSSLHLLAVRNRMFIRMNSLPDMSSHKKVVSPPSMLEEEINDMS